MTDFFRFAAFISYSSEDAVFARRLHRALENYAIPSALGTFDLLGGGGKRNRIYPVFRDREELSAGDLGERIEAALRASASLIVVCSPNAAKSRWVQKEIEYFVSLGRKDRIFAIIADSAPLRTENGEDATALNFPPALRGTALADAKALEPLAADARKGKDGFRNAWLKLVAGMIGVTPGQIVDRDKKRRKQRALLNSALAFAAIVLVAAFWFRFELGRAWAQTTMAHLSSPAVLAALKNREVFSECSGSLKCPPMVVLNGGKFLMGSPPDEVGRFDDEGPQREILVPRFAMGKYDVTYEEWATCVAYTDQHALEKQRNAHAPLMGCAPTTDSGFGGGAHPAINVSWDDAQGYVRWLNFMIAGNAYRGPYRLASEAEWEFAARAGVSAPYFWGGDAARLCEFANVMTRQTKTKYPALHGQLGDAPPCEDNYLETSPVGAFKPNSFGLYDMYGDVWQWVEDCYGAYKQGRTGAAAVEHAGPPEACASRVLRGASWRQTPRNLRSARRGKYPPGSRYFDVGFRVARSL